MERTKLIAMRNDLGLGHKGDILLTTQERVDANQEPIAKDIIDEEHAKEFVRRWNAFEDDGLVDGLVEALEHIRIIPRNFKSGMTYEKRMVRMIVIAEAAIAKAT